MGNQNRPVRKLLACGVLMLGAVFIILAFSTYWFIFGLDSWLFQRDLERPADQRLLFVGNSFTYQNDMDQMVADLIRSGENGPERLFSTRVAFGGYRLFDHWDDVLDNEPDAPIRQFLVDGDAQVENWDLVVLQEQVEIPGLETYEKSRANSWLATAELGTLADGLGAQIIVMETWGVAADPNDPDNPYPDFPIMQNQLHDANLELIAMLKGNDIGAGLAPAGQAFLIVYEDALEAGYDPMDSESWFLRLFDEDRQHANVAGSYLAAAVVTASYTQESVADLEWRPAELDAEFAAYLREVADRAVFE